MFWIIVIVICAIVACCLESVPGKVVMGSGVLAIGLLLLGWIFDLAFFFTLAKICAAIIVITIVGSIIMGIID